MPHKPEWFKDGKVIVSNAPTCGVNKDGLDQFEVDSSTGARKLTIDDRLLIDASLLQKGKIGGYIMEIKQKVVDDISVYVPKYYDSKYNDKINQLIKKLPGFELKSILDLRKEAKIKVMKGHGSPSADQRVGDIPYIKVSDIRAGHININPSNLIPRPLAESYWRGAQSNLLAYDLISPERASKNIGEFSVLMPGQEQIVLTKEVIVVRSLTKEVDQFYLMWALSLAAVRAQWNRIIFMQTNREDVGDRLNEVLIPFPKNKEKGYSISEPFRKYYLSLEKARSNFKSDLKDSKYGNDFLVN